MQDVRKPPLLNFADFRQSTGWSMLGVQASMTHESNGLEQ
jgi:hypothetical protein